MNHSKRIIVGVAILLATVIVLSSCAYANASQQRIVGNGRVKTEQRSTAKFDKVAILGSADVEVRQGKLKLEVKGEENILPYLITDVSGSTLQVKMKSNSNISTRKGLKVIVTVPDMKYIEVRGSGDVDLYSLRSKSLKVQINGSGDVDLGNSQIEDLTLQINGSGDIEGTVQGGKLTVQINGSGDVDVNLNNVQTATISSNGSGDVELKGSARSIAFSSAGSGDLDGRSLRAQTATVRMSGSASGSMTVVKHLDLTLSGSSDFICYGNPTIGALSVSKSSNFSKRP